MNSAPEAGLASLLASRGRGGDSMLVHMGPEEVRGLQSIALAHGGSLTINPVTGMVEANFLKKLLPAIAGFTLNSLFPNMGAFGTSLLVGGATGLIEGDLKKGINAGMGAYSGANIRQALAQAGQAAKKAAEAEAAKKLTGGVTAGDQKFLAESKIGEDIIERTMPTAPPVTPTVAPTPATSMRMPAGITNIANKIGQSKFGQSDMGAGIMSLFRPGGGEQMVKYLGGPNQAGMTFAPIMSAIDEAEQERNAKKMRQISEGDNYFYIPGAFNQQAGKFEPGRYVDAKGNPYTKPFKWGFADGGVIPSRGNMYPMARLQAGGMGGYDTPIDSMNGQESPVTNFAEGGTVDPLEDYYRSLLAPPSSTNPNQADVDANTKYVDEWNKIFAGGMRDFGGKGASAASYYVPSTVVTPAAGTSAVPAGPTPVETIGETIKPEASPVQEPLTPPESGGAAGPAGTTITPPPPPPPPPKTAVTSIEEIDPNTVIGGSGPVSESIIDAAPGAGGAKDPEKKGEIEITTDPSTAAEDYVGKYGDILTSNISQNYKGAPEYASKIYSVTVPEVLSKEQAEAADRAAAEEAAKAAEEAAKAAEEQAKKDAEEQAKKEAENKKPESFVDKLLEFAKEKGPEIVGSALAGVPGALLGNYIGKKFIPSVEEMTQQEQAEADAAKAQREAAAVKEAADKAAAEEAAAAEAARREKEAREAAERAAYEASLATSRGGQGGSAIPWVTSLAAERGALGRAAGEVEKRGEITIEELMEGEDGGGRAAGGPIGPVADDYYNFGFARGGLGTLPEYKAGGKLLRGPGDGMSDDIPAVIRGAKVQRAALADGEFVIPADVVSHLGNGSTEAGAKKLYQMMDKIRVARTGNKRQGRQINPDKFLPV
jgi:hypothetical protein